MTLTASSSSRYRVIMTVNQGLETQESWLEALLQRREGVGECWNKEKNIFLRVCNNFWLREDEMMNFVLRVSHEMKLHACSFAQKIWSCLPWH